MKFRVTLILGAFLTIVSLLHASWNIGWKVLAEDVQVLFGAERGSLHVGYLPVT